MVFWHQKLFTLTRFAQALRQTKFVITMLTYSSYDQGIADFQLEGFEDRQRRDLFLNSFDEDLQVAAKPHYEPELNSRRTRKPDAVLERIEQQREDESYETRRGI